MEARLKSNRAYAKVSHVAIIVEPAAAIEVKPLDPRLGLGICCIDVHVGAFDDVMLYLSEAAYNQVLDSLRNI